MNANVQDFVRYKNTWVFVDILIFVVKKCKKPWLLVFFTPIMRT
jgi:hypothetical protein